MLLVEGVIGLVVCLGVAATGGGVTLGGLPQPAAGGGGGEPSGRACKPR